MRVGADDARAGRAAGAAAAAAAALLCAALVAQLAAPAAAHGMMVHPMSRNFKGYLDWTHFGDPHSLSMGGAGVVSDSGKLKYPNGRLNYCGDAYNVTKWDQPGGVMATYKQGRTVNVDTLIAVNHMGTIAMQICDLNAKPGKGQCRSLRLKAAGPYNGTLSWWLPALQHKWEGGNHGREAPKYGDGTFQTYRMPRITEKSGWGCYGRRTCEDFTDYVVYRTQWTLPPGFTCEHCKLQWVWTTGHLCWPACEAGHPSPQCVNRQPYPTCGAPGANYPESFVNCADVRVTRDWADASSDLPKWNGVVEVKKGTWGTVTPPVLHSS